MSEIGIKRTVAIINVNELDYTSKIQCRVKRCKL